MAAVSSPTCVSCHQSQQELQTGTLKLCSGCRTVFYCSPNCQRADWKNHKSDCVNMQRAFKTLESLPIDPDARTALQRQEQYFRRVEKAPATVDSRKAAQRIDHLTRHITNPEQKAIQKALGESLKSRDYVHVLENTLDLRVQQLQSIQDMLSKLPRQQMKRAKKEVAAMAARVKQDRNNKSTLAQDFQILHRIGLELLQRQIADLAITGTEESAQS